MSLEEIIQAVSFLPTFMPEEDIECLYKYANLINHGVIVDVGTGWGKSMLILGLSNRKNQVITCDPGDYPIHQNWAEDLKDYKQKINKIIIDFDLKSNIQFFPDKAEDLINRLVEEIDIIHFDNWAEISNTDTSALLKEYVDKLLYGGYFLARNYDRGDRQPYTDSVDKATKGLKKIETMGLITVWQK